MSDSRIARDLLASLVERELVGPSSPDEIIEESPQSRYIVAQLAPSILSEGDDTDESDDIELDDTIVASAEAEEAAHVSDDRSSPESVGASRSASLSSIGLAFVVERNTTVKVIAGWGEYSCVSPGMYRRTPCEAALNICFDGPCGLEQQEHGRATFRWIARPVGNLLLCSLFFVNTTTAIMDDGTDRLYQVRISLKGCDGKRPFLTRDRVASVSQPSAEDLLYRERREFAAGLNCAIREDDVDPSGQLAGALYSLTMPTVETWITEARGFPDVALLSMSALARATDPKELVEQFRRSFQGYKQWIELRATEADSLDERFRPLARKQVLELRRRFARLDAGLSMLESDPKVFEAFRFANECLARSRYRLAHGKNALDAEWSDALGGNWFPFQLAFLLSQIAEIVNEHDPNRDVVDVLFFPTGGGKTEAYLGVAVFAMAWRRLSEKSPYGGGGMSVLMRYTLRLLTNQQFARAASVICAAELIRRHEDNPARYGEVPFSIGLWVGPMTPNNFEIALAELDDARRAHNHCELACPLSGAPKDGPPRREGADRGFMVITECPWCGTALCVDAVRTVKNPNRVEMACSNAACPFGQGQRIGQLPIWFVDTDVYREVPTLLIGTVDKFATLPYRGEAKAIFGNVRGHCNICGFLTDVVPHKRRCDGIVRNEGGMRSADLIIQDELHTITDNIGSVYGIFEAAVEFLSSRNSAPPKYLAATATVKNVDRQIQQLYGGRRAAVFPPAGLEAGDTYFSYDRAPTEGRPGRLYVGIYAPTKSRLSTFVAVLGAVLASARSVFDEYGSAADQLMTLLGYFNTIRDLGAVKALLADDVPPVLKRIAKERGWTERELESWEDELTGRIESGEVPQRLAQLAKDFSKGGACDFMACTNMISVGVDISRLGVMVVDGQPKTTAEYIQATSRVGRSSPGIVFVVYNAMRPRDVSHYEHFHSYHRSYYRFVEAGSVTPYSAGCVARYLAGAFVAGYRLADERSDNEAAERFKADESGNASVLSAFFRDRAAKFGEHEFETVSIEVDRLISHWSLERSKIRYLKPSIPPAFRKANAPKAKQGARPVIAPPEEARDHRNVASEARPLFIAPRSMRNVEPTVPLRVRDR